mgnify:FL=1
MASPFFQWDQGGCGSPARVSCVWPCPSDVAWPDRVSALSGPDLHVCPSHRDQPGWWLSSSVRPLKACQEALGSRTCRVHHAELAAGSLARGRRVVASKHRGTRTYPRRVLSSRPEQKGIRNCCRACALCAGSLSVSGITHEACLIRWDSPLGCCSRSWRATRSMTVVTIWSSPRMVPTPRTWGWSRARPTSVGLRHVMVRGRAALE